MKPLYAILVNNVLFALAYTDKEVDEKCEKALERYLPDDIFVTTYERYRDFVK